jgi:hypothetical protein
MISLRRFTVVCTLCAAHVACGGTEPPGPPVGIEPLDGDNQVGTVGQPLASPIRVRVVDADGRGVDNVGVRFNVTEGGGTVEAPGAGLSGGLALVQDSSVSVTTDGTGEAQVIWTLGPPAGTQRLVAEVQGLAPAEFSATAEPGPPAALAAAGGDGQLATPGTELPDTLAARVVDEFGNPLAINELGVSWDVIGGGGSAVFDTETDAAGVARAVLTLGPGIGFNTVTATAGGLDPAEFNALALTLVQADAAEDTFSLGISGVAVMPDILVFGAAWDVDSLIIGLAFKDSVVMARQGGPNAVAGLVEFDIDLDSQTGIESQVDVHRPGGNPTGMGVDVMVDLFGDEDGSYVIFDSRPEIIGATTPDIRGRLIGFYVPSSLIGTSDLRTAAIVGTVAEPTDIVPNDGSVLVAGAGGVPARAAVLPAGLRLPALRFWRR